MKYETTVSRLQGEAQRMQREVAAHLAVWTREPITRCPVNEQNARNAAAKAAYHDGGQDLLQVIT